MIIIDRLLTPGASHGRNQLKLSPVGIIVHYVGNAGSSAEANRNWFESGSSGNGVSSHYIIGLKGEVLQCIPDDERAAHAGKSYSPEYDQIAKTNNSRYLGIECCHPTADGHYNEYTYASLVELCAHLCVKFGFNPAKDIVRHYDVSGKICPLYYVRNADAWQILKSDIVAATNALMGEPGEPAGTPIIGPATVSLEQMIQWSKNKRASETFTEIAPKFYGISLEAGIDPAVAYCQSAKETGLGHFGGIVSEKFHNTCGMKTTIGGEDSLPSSYMFFETWDQGIAAQVDHLSLYAGQYRENSPDPRHFMYLQGRASTVEALGGNWAPSPAYGVEIVNMMIDLVSTIVAAPEPGPEETGKPAEPGKTGEAPSEWAKESWEWAIASGITDGTDPHGAATREQVAAMIQRSLKTGF